LGRDSIEPSTPPREFNNPSKETVFGPSLPGVAIL
jgi:hypothetical protein